MSKAEFIIVLDWEGTLDVDVDLWVQDPLGNTVHFRRSDIGLVHLDRDDLGLSNDTVLLQGEEVVAVINREVTSIRGYIPGEWVINTHWFSNTVGFVGNLPVKVELIRVNPYEVVYTREFEMQHLREEKTAFRFTMGASGWCRDYNETMISIIKGVPIDHPAGPSPAMKRQMEENMNSGEE